MTAFVHNIYHYSRNTPWGGATGDADFILFGPDYTSAAFAMSFALASGGSALFNLTKTSAGSQGISATFENPFTHPVSGEVGSATIVRPQIDEATLKGLAWGPDTAQPLVLNYDLLMTPLGPAPAGNLPRDLHSLLRGRRLMPPVFMDARRFPPTMYENTDVALARQYRDQAQAAADAGGGVVADIPALMAPYVSDAAAQAALSAGQAVAWDNEFTNGGMLNGAEGWASYFNVDGTHPGLSTTSDTFMQALGINQEFAATASGGIQQSAVQDMSRDITGLYAIGSIVVRSTDGTTWPGNFFFGSATSATAGATSATSIAITFEQLDVNRRLYTFIGRLSTTAGQRFGMLGCTDSTGKAGVGFGGFSMALNSDRPFTSAGQLRRFGWRRESDKRRIPARMASLEISVAPKGQLPNVIVNGGLADGAEAWTMFQASAVLPASTTDPVFLAYGLTQTIQPSGASIFQFARTDLGYDAASQYIQVGTLVKRATGGTWPSMQALVGTIATGGGTALVGATTGYVEIDTTHRFYWMRGQVPAAAGSRYLMIGTFTATGMAGAEFGGFSGALRKTPFIAVNEVDHFTFLTLNDQQRLPQRMKAAEDAISSGPAITATVLDLYIPADLYVLAGRPMPLYVQNANATWKDDPDFVMTLAGSVGAAGATRAVLDASREKLMIDPAAINGAGKIGVRSMSGNQTLRKVVPVNIHVAPTGQSASSSRLLCIGDSIFTFGMALKAASKATTILGLPCAQIGTRNAGGLAEQRPGRRFADYIYKMTDQLAPVTIGSEAAYLAMTDADKLLYNPMIRPAVGGDDPTRVFNGYIFDPASYLTRFSLQTPTHVAIGLGRNDLTLVAGRTQAAILADIHDGMRVMYTQLRAAWPTAYISFVWHVTSKTTNGDAEWSAYLSVYAREFMKFVKAQADTRLKFLAGYLHSPRDGFDTVATTQTTDADTGMQSVTLSDHYHFSGIYLEQESDMVAAWIGATQAGV